MKDNTSKYIILGILSYKPRTGYDIHKLVKTRMGPFLDISYSQIYPTLHHLEKENLLTKKVEINNRGQNRKIYEITSEGKNKLKDWLTKPAKPETFKIELLLKVAFGEKASEEDIITHIQEFKTRNVKQLENIYAIKKELKQNLNQSERYFFGLLPFELGIKLHKAAIDWADTTIKQIKEHYQNCSY